MTIKTNHQWRNLLSGYELPAKCRREFDYLSDEEYPAHDFVLYRGNYYDVDEFSYVDARSPLKGWDGYRPDSYFSGVVIKIHRDHDQCIMGTYFS